jgi:hypothetical protein
LSSDFKELTTSESTPGSDNSGLEPLWNAVNMSVTLDEVNADCAFEELVFAFLIREEKIEIGEARKPATMSSPRSISLFRELTFYYPRSAPDFDEVYRKIDINGGTMTQHMEFARIKLAHVPCFEPGDFYDISLIDDSIKSDSVKPLSDYLIAPDFGYAWITSERELASNNVSPTYGAHYREVMSRYQTSPFQNRLRAQSPRSPLMPFRPHPIKRDVDPMILRGRQFYLLFDDLRIIDFIRSEATDGARANGENLWRQAADVRLIPGRSDQSMRGRYMKTIRNKWQEHYEPHYRRWKNEGHSWRDPYVDDKKKM